MNLQKDISALELFNEKAIKLSQCDFTKKAFDQDSGISVSGFNEQFQIERRGPSEENIDAFVLTFRFFIQDNDRSSFQNIAYVYDDLPISEDKKKLFIEIKKRLNEFLDSKSNVILNNKTYTYREIQEIFIYGGLAHANITRKEVFDRWVALPGNSFQFMINEFVYTVGNVLNFIMHVKNLNEEVLKEIK